MLRRPRACRLFAPSFFLLREVNLLFSLAFPFCAFNLLVTVKLIQCYYYWILSFFYVASSSRFLNQSLKTKQFQKAQTVHLLPPFEMSCSSFIMLTWLWGKPYFFFQKLFLFMIHWITRDMCRSVPLSLGCSTVSTHYVSAAVPSLPTISRLQYRLRPLSLGCSTVSAHYLSAAVPSPPTISRLQYRLRPLSLGCSTVSDHRLSDTMGCRCSLDSPWRSPAWSSSPGPRWRGRPAIRRGRSRSPEGGREGGMRTLSDTARHTKPTMHCHQRGFSVRPQGRNLPGDFGNGNSPKLKIVIFYKEKHIYLFLQMLYKTCIHVGETCGKTLGVIVFFKSLTFAK